MSGSESRYSIVERLTNTKLGLVDSQSQIDEKLAENEQTIQSFENDLEVYKEQSQEDIVREIKQKENEINKLKTALGFDKKQKETKLKAIDTKIEQLDNALKAIEKISETAPTPQEQVSRQ